MAEADNSFTAKLAQPFIRPYAYVQLMMFSQNSPGHRLAYEFIVNIDVGPAHLSLQCV